MFLNKLARAAISLRFVSLQTVIEDSACVLITSGYLDSRVPVPYRNESGLRIRLAPLVAKLPVAVIPPAAHTAIVQDRACVKIPRGNLNSGPTSTQATSKGRLVLYLTFAALPVS